MALQHKSGLLAIIVLSATVLAPIIGMSVFAASYYSKVQSHGQIKTVNVSVYWNSACTNLTTSIDWGILTPGTTKSLTLYVKNDGNVPLKLNMTTQNYSPTSASNYLRLTWNCEAQIINAASTKAATFTLAVSSSITGVTSFSFDITIAGIQQ